MQSEVKRLINEVRPYKKSVLLIGVAGVIYAASYSRLALMVKELSDALNVGDPKHMLSIAGVAIGLALLAAVSRYYHIFMMNYIAEVVVQGLRQKLQQKFMRLSLSFHNNYHTGAGGLISRILNDIKIIQDGLRMVADIFLHPLLLCLLVGNLFYIDWKLTLFIFLVVPVIVLFLRSISRSLRKYSPMGQDNLERMTSTIKESLDGVRIIQSFNLESMMGKKLVDESNDYLSIRKKVHSRVEVAGPVTEFIATGVVLSVLIYSSYEIAAGRATPGAFMGFVTSLLMANQPIKKFQESYVRIQEVIVAAKRVFAILDDPHEVPESTANLPFPKDWKTITYKNVIFSYGHEQILKGINLEIKRGELIALVGESGSGKSTIVNLLERFFDPTSGEILIDNIPIQSINLKELRKNVALVSQDVFLFSDTIENNIWAGDFSKPKDNVIAMAKSANAHEFIMKTPGGYQSRVGDRGSLLSGGEKQRLSIARALFKDAPILILDEATSALDSASEIEVQRGLDLLLQDRTALVVAHRLSTIQKADRIVVLKAGQIVEIGRHDELLLNKGEYHRFYTLQS